MEEENLKNLLHDDQAAIQRAEALLSRIANDTAKVDEPYMSKRNKFQREKTQGISPRRDHGEFHDTEIPEPSTYIDDSVGLDSSYLSKVYREKDAPPSASYNSIGFDFALSLAAEKEKGQLLLHDRLEEHSDTHVNMAQCLAIGKEGEQPYGNPATAKKYMNVCFKDKVIGTPQSISVLGDVDKSIAAQMRDEYETWMLLWRLHTGLVESEEVDTFPSCPQAAINQRYYSDRKLQLWNIVVRWYHQLTSERSKLKKSQDISPNAAVSGVYLPCTTEALRKQRKGTLRRIDPDASFKGLILEPDDQDDSIVLLERIWQLITEGAFYTEIDGDFQAYQETLCRQVENICIEAGQPWRAASFSGGMPYRRNPSSLSTTSWQGNAYRALWSDICRRTSYKLGEKTQQLSDSPSDRAQLRATELERVIYACLGGDVENLLRSPLCQDWRQQSWAMFRCVVQSHFDGTCVENRRVLSDALGHIPGPEDPKYENSHAERALSASSFDEHHVFIRTAEHVPKEELQFFRVQRAFIEGRFHALVDRSNAPDNLYDGFDLAEFLCGPDWEVCSILTVARICGVEYVSLYQTAGESLAGRGLSKESFSRMSLESAPCWENESRAFAAQLLRFTAHACIYMSNLTTLSSVVDEECPKSSIQLATEAIVLAYVQFLLTDDCFLYDRYALVPVFLP